MTTMVLNFIYVALKIHTHLWARSSRSYIHRQCCNNTCSTCIISLPFLALKLPFGSQSKLVVLQSLSLFLKRALSLPYESPHNPEPVSATMPVHSWYLARSFLSPEAYESFEGYLQPSSQTQQGSSSCHMWKSEVEFEDEDFVTFGLPTCSYWDLQSLSEVTKVSGGHADAHTYQKGDPSIVAVRVELLNYGSTPITFCPASSTHIELDSDIHVPGLRSNSIFTCWTTSGDRIASYHSGFRNRIQPLRCHSTRYHISTSSQVVRYARIVNIFTRYLEPNKKPSRTCGLS